MTIKDEFIRRTGLAATALSTLLLAAALVPAGSYAAASCSGRTSLGDGAIGDNDVQYRFGCSETIKGFSIVTNTTVEIFSENANAFNPATSAQVEKQSFDCVGDIPGVGVSCSGGTAGFAAGGNRVVGNLGLAKSPCQTKRRLRVWLVVSDSKGAVSGPFQLGGPRDCPARESRRSKGAQRHRR
jgi:hypothetical protein